jgi:Domain of unknown function (DUF4145)
MSMSENDIVRSHCNKCGNLNKHSIVASRESIEIEEIDFGNGNYFGIEWKTRYSMLECCGCGDISLKCVTYTENGPPDEIADSYFPPRVSRREPTWFKKLPKEYGTLIREIYSSLHADNRFLSAMGARAIIDLFIFRKVGDCGSFSQGLKTLVDKGYITVRNKGVIESVVEAGHAASHRAHRPTEEQLNSVMDIVESLIQQDLLEESAEKLKKSIPKRSDRKK